MAFWGCSFTYNGVSSTSYDLELCDADGDAQGGGGFASTVSIIEDASSQKVRPLFYGTRFDNKLQMTLVCALNNDRIDAQEFLTRQELDRIATWLTGHDDYKWLTIDQADLLDVRYKCIITELNILESGMEPYGIQFVATCDGPYAYRKTPFTDTRTVSGTLEFSVNNDSSLNKLFYPVVEFAPTNGGNLEIVNESDNGRTFSITNIPASISSIRIDSDKCLIENDQDLNLYENCNFKFPRLKRGTNLLKVTGNGTIKLICDFPVNPGT